MAFTPIRGAWTLERWPAKISVDLGTGNYARGLYAYGNTMDYQGPRYKDVNIGTFSSTGSISAATAGGYGAQEASSPTTGR